MRISAKTWAVEGITFTYTNGATLQVVFEHHRGVTQYHLARDAKVVARFPNYNGDATITYGNYVLNQPIAPSTFQQH